MFIPYQSILIPLIQFLQLVKLYGTIPGLITVHVLYGLPISSLIFRNYFANIPDELLEASRIDGAGIIRTYTHVMFPLSMPAFIVVGIFQFTNVWNDFLFGVTILPNPVAQPVTVALNNLSGSYSVDWNVVMAGAVIAALPTALVYIFLGRFFVRGLLSRIGERLAYYQISIYGKLRCSHNRNRNGRRGFGLRAPRFGPENTVIGARRLPTVGTGQLGSGSGFHAKEV